MGENGCNHVLMLQYAKFCVKLSFNLNLKNSPPLLARGDFLDRVDSEAGKNKPWESRKTRKVREKTSK